MYMNSERYQDLVVYIKNSTGRAGKTSVLGEYKRVGVSEFDTIGNKSLFLLVLR